MVEISKSYLLNRVADLTANEVILNELKSYLVTRSKSSSFSSYSLGCLIVLDKIRQLELKYKGVKQ